MVQKLHIIRILWVVTACLAVTTALIGAVNQDIYSKIAEP
jgi:hypothetical protein